MPAAITITGRLSKDVEFKNPGSTTLAILSIPTDKGWGDRKETTWWNVSVWGKQAERIQSAIENHSMYQKGDTVTVVGVPSVRQYTNNQGVKGFSAEVEALQVDPVFAPKNDSAPSYNNYGGGSPDDAPPF